MSKSRRPFPSPVSESTSEPASPPAPIMRADPIDSCVGCGSPTYIRITGDLDEAVLRRFAGGEGRVLRHMSSDYAVISFPNFFSHGEAIAAFDSFIQDLPQNLLIVESPSLIPVPLDDRESSAPLVAPEESSLSRPGEPEPGLPSEPG